MMISFNPFGMTITAYDNIPKWLDANSNSYFDASAQEKQNYNVCAVLGNAMPFC